MKTMKKTLLVAAISAASTQAMAGFYVDLQANQSELDRSGLDWYAPYGVDGADIVGAGDYEYLEPSSETGLALGVGMDLGSNWTGTVRFSDIDFSEKDTVSSPGQELVASRVHADDGDVDEGDWDFGRSEFELEQETIEVEFAYNVKFGGDKGLVSPLFGLRSTSIEQSMDTLYDDTTSTSAGTFVSESVDHDLLGLYAGVEGLWKFNRLVGVEGRVDIGVMNADVSRSNRETIEDGGTVYVDTGDDFTESATMTNAKLGVVFTALESDSLNLDISLGMQYSNIDGLSDFIHFPDDVVDGVLARNQQSLGTSGYYLNVGASF